MVQLRHAVGALQIDVDFVLAQPWTVLFGPSGSGKTTILRAIAGLMRPDYGLIVTTHMPGTILERAHTTVDTSTGTFLSAYKRAVRLAPQRPSLFPHLTVLENMSYSRAFDSNRLEDQEHMERQMAELLSAFHLSHLVTNRPGKLSGGEAQRVNLARAVAGATDLLLLDEPFTGLDAALRSELLNHLKEWATCRKLCVLSVTHDIAEAFQLNAEVIKLAEGRIVQQGPVAEVLAEERARLLAQLGGSAT